MIGIDVNQKKVEYHQDRLQDNIKEILHDISYLEVVQEFEGGVKKFNPNSPKDLTEVLRDILGFDEGKQPDGGYSTAESVLELIDHPLSDLVLELRHAVKLKSTYVDSLHANAKRYIWPDTKLHPNLNTMRTVTRRLSSDSPNEQNFPKERDSEIRDMIIPRDGDYFVSCDYGQIEFRVIGMASKDKVLCELIRNRYDVHTEWGKKIVDKDSSIIGGRKFLTDETTMKELRQIAKNKFVFPACFGAEAPSISDSLGISKSYVRELLKEFWDTFTGVKEWQEGLRKFYDKNGYVELLTGFRRRGPLSINKIINTPIQGTASEIVISGMNSLSELACSEDKRQFQAIMNIHDDLSFSVPKETFDDDLEIIIGEMLGVEYEFMNVPISIDVSLGENWFDLSEVGTFHSDEW
jgi:DNA polymerase-1